jgi:hypothetical protein
MLWRAVRREGRALVRLFDPLQDEPTQTWGSLLLGMVSHAETLLGVELGISLL